MDWFEAALSFTLRWEGGFQNDPADSGNWTGGKVGVGALVGTKYGISAASYPNLDIPNLTLAQAGEIYRRDYWNALNLDTLEDYRMALLMFDSAVQHGKARAGEWLWAHPTPHEFYANRLHFYSTLTDFPKYGRGWSRRMAALAEEVFGLQSPCLEAMRRFFLVFWGNIQVQLPFARATTVGDKLYVRMFDKGPDS